jgi:hypothetical protein
LVSNGGYAAFAEDASGRYLTSVRVGKAAAGCTNSASKGGDKLNPLSFMTLLAARRQMALRVVRQIGMRGMALWPSAPR